jgi:hypothetical protein
MRRRGTSLLVAVLLLAGCAGPTKLARRSDDRLAEGRVWQAWQLATRALDKAPGNPEARAAADRAAAAIAEDWQRRIRALAPVDSLGAAEQVLEFVAFRAGAARHASVPVDAAWTRDEQALRQSAARHHYRGGVEAMKERRPKRAYHHFADAERFWAGHRDAAQRAARALEAATTHLAIVPLATPPGSPTLGHDVAASWRGDVVEALEPGTTFTRVLPLEAVERSLRVSDLRHLDREDAVRIGREAGADRIVWGTIGDVDEKSGIHVFSDRVARKIVEKDAEGRRSVRWVEVPLEVISRVKTVDVDLEFEVIATRDGSTLARQRGTRTTKARVVWTAYAPEDGPDAYALVSEETRASNPDRTRQVEAKWSAVVGEGTTLAQVLEAKRRSKGSNDRREALGRIMAGAAFVLLEELPSTDELAFAALAGAWRPLCDDLVRLDAVDDADLGVGSASAADR